MPIKIKPADKMPQTLSADQFRPGHYYKHLDSDDFYIGTASIKTDMGDLIVGINLSTGKYLSTTPTTPKRYVEVNLVCEFKVA